MKRVGVLRGGAGEHYASSLVRGGHIISHIFENLSHKYKVIDILIDKEGVWHLNGLPCKPDHLMNKVDIAWNVSLPDVSVILDNFSIPNIGPGFFPHALATSKEMLRKHIEQAKISMPRFVVLPVYQKDFDGPEEKYSIKKAQEVFEKFGSPWVVRPFTPDANMAVHLARTFNELVAAIEDGLKRKKSILVEEFIVGKVASVHSVPNFRNQGTYIFPPVNVFGTLSGEEKQKMSNLAKELHAHFGARHYLKSNFVINKRGRVYLLDIELTPNLRPFSHFSQACESVGVKMHDVVDHMLGQVFKNN